MTEHTKTDGLPGMDMPVLPEVAGARAAAQRAHERRQGRVQRLPGAVPDRRRQAPAPATATPTATACWCASIRCVLLRRDAGQRRAGAGALRAAGGRAAGRRRRADWSGDLLHADEVFVTGVGSSTTYPDYKPAPFIVGSQGRRRRHGDRGHRGHLQLLQLQGEDRHRPLPRRRAGQRALPRRGRRPRHHRRVRLADAVARRRAPPHRRQQEGRPHDGRADAAAGQQAGRSNARSTAAPAWSIQAGRAPIVNGVEEQRMRVGCGSATVGIFARAALRPCRRGGGGRRPHHRRADRAPGRPLPRHAALGHPDARAQVARRGATSRWPTRATAGAAPTSPIRCRSSKAGTQGVARPGLRLLMTSTTGEHAQWYVLDEALRPRRAGDAGRGAPHRRAHRRELRARR